MNPSLKYLGNLLSRQSICEQQFSSIPLGPSKGNNMLTKGWTHRVKLWKLRASFSFTSAIVRITTILF